MNSFERARLVTKEEIIQMGLRYMEGVGVKSVCKVCISKGGSCCMYCNHLKEGVGCQQRNTSCTSWLCGFLRYIYFEVGILAEWEQFWEQIPGKAFRMDYTPSEITITKELEPVNIKYIGQAFAKDLDYLTNEDKEYTINEFNNKLDRFVSWFSIHKDSITLGEASIELNKLSNKLSSFQLAIQEYKNN